jgi:hypothetical protein
MLCDFRILLEPDSCQHMTACQKFKFYGIIQFIFKILRSSNTVYMAAGCVLWQCKVKTNLVELIKSQVYDRSGTAVFMSGLLVFKMFGLTTSAVCIETDACLVSDMAYPIPPLVAILKLMSVRLRNLFAHLSGSDAPTDV